MYLICQTLSERLLPLILQRIYACRRIIVDLKRKYPYTNVKYRIVLSLNVDERFATVLYITLFINVYKKDLLS